MFTFRFPGQGDRAHADPVAAIFTAIRRQVPRCRHGVLQRLLELAIEIAREGREGRRIGTVFTLGGADRVLALSRPLILDPLAGHAPNGTSIFDDSACGTIKELAHAGLIVLDEGHMLGPNEREVRYEALVQRLVRRSDAAERRIVCLSALFSTPQEMSDLVAWLRADEPGDPIHSAWRPTRQRFGTLR